MATIAIAALEGQAENDSRECTVKQPVHARFYRPGLDALRFIAFSAVFFFHGPALENQVFYEFFRKMGGFGLQLFFLLSAFLIVSLLLQERDLKSTVNLKAFYCRRILRIWPLYYLTVGIGVVLSLLSPADDYLGKVRIAGLVFFFMNWVIGGIGNPISVLWSISVEEQFYALWPWVAKSKQPWLAPAVSALLIVGGFLPLLSGCSWRSAWFNTFVEFQFFGTGSLLALALHRKSITISRLYCLSLFLLGTLCASAAQIFCGIVEPRVSPTKFQMCLGYGLVDVGCSCLLLAFLYAPQTLWPKSLLRFGTISYGLYVFHKFPLVAAKRVFSAAAQGLPGALAIDLCCLIVTLAAATLAYKYVETPFLRLKRRYTMVPSKPL